MSNLFPVTRASVQRALLALTLLVGGSVASAQTVDTQIPKISILAPKNKSSVPTNATPYEVWIGGKATDDVSVTNVYYSLNGEDYTPATLTTPEGKVVFWTNAVTVKPGTNVVSAFSSDSLGKDSFIQTFTFYYDVRTPFTLQINSDPELTDAGTNGFIIKPLASSKLGTNDGNSPLLVGRSYTLTVVPNITNGYLFSKFTAHSDENPAERDLLDFADEETYKLSYVMESNMVITAHFVTNQFRVNQGVYNGLFAEEDETRLHSAGYFTLKLSEKRSFSGKLLLDGDAVPFSGKFNLDGFTFASASRAKFGKPDLLMILNLDPCGQVISGDVMDMENGWYSGVFADRMVWGKTWEGITNQSTVFSNAYTMVLPGFEDTNCGPAGFNHASIVVNNKGQVKVRGYTADGQRIAQATTISKEGYWPFFAPLYIDNTDINKITSKPLKRSRGMMMGWMFFGNDCGCGVIVEEGSEEEPISYAPQGDVTWIKTSAWTNANWSAGFTNDSIWGVSVLSSVHTPEPANEPLYGTATNFFSILAEGGIDPIFNPFYMKANNTFAVNAKSPEYNHKFAVKLNNKLGTVFGSFTNDLGTRVKWSGVMLQEIGVGFGSFMNTNVLNGGGLVLIVPEGLVEPEEPTE